MNSPQGNSTKNTRQQLRQKLRHARRQLSPKQQQIAAAQLKSVLSRQLFVRRARRLAFYLPADGEISPLPLQSFCQASNKQCFLPVLHPFREGQLHFARYTRGNRLVTNHFGIPEPDIKHNSICQPWALDIVFLPLVGFDQSGNRLGMGGGFYDRSFAFKQRDKLNSSHRPLLIGLAHSLQEVDALSSEHWDVPLFGIATEKGFYKAC